MCRYVYTILVVLGSFVLNAPADELGEGETKRPISEQKKAHLRLFAEEEKLWLELERALEKLSSARARMRDQFAKLDWTPRPSSELFALRFEQIHDDVLAAKKIIRSAEVSFQALFKKLKKEYPESESLRWDETRICEPLADITAAKNGSLGLAEDVLQKQIRQLRKGFGADVKQFQKVRFSLETLEDQIKRVMERTSAPERVSFLGVAIKLIRLERDQRRIANMLGPNHGTPRPLFDLIRD